MLYYIFIYIFVTLHDYTAQGIKGETAILNTF